LEPAGPWRTWRGTTRPASYRLAADLLDELDERTHSLRLPIGLTVTAALLQLLDMSDDEVVRLVDRAEESPRTRTARSSTAARSASELNARRRARGRPGATKRAAPMQTLVFANCKGRVGKTAVSSAEANRRYVTSIMSGQLAAIGLRG